MRFATIQAAVGSASVLFAAQPVTATHGHRHAHDQYAKRHSHNHDGGLIVKRSSCSLPDHPDLVRVPGAVNNGFAMSPDEPCEDGKWCPYACVPGKVMAQWEPNSSYVYPESMNGGLFCNDGTPEKAFDDQPYCVDGTGTVKAVNKCGKVVSFCQTVLPGNEAMIIPTDVDSEQTIAVPGVKYWAKTAAHYYINEPGVDSSKGCVWGDPSQPIGNWSPYVAGANTVDNGDTYVKIAWNPIWLESGLSNKEPNFGIRVACPGGGCNGMPCAINPATNGIGGVESPVKTVGVGGANFCVVTVPKGKTANLEVFYTDGSTGPKPAPPKPPKPSTTSTTSTTAAPTTSSTTSSSSEALTTSSSIVSSSSSSEAEPSSTEEHPWGGIFRENTTYTTISKEEYSSIITTAMPFSTAASEKPESVSSSTSKNDGAAPDQGGTAIAGLVVALVAAAALY
ncbi:Beta-glucosidase (SUN family) domain containing protein [Rhypophila sp. PSN 637]